MHSGGDLRGLSVAQWLVSHTGGFRRRGKRQAAPALLQWRPSARQAGPRL